MTLHVSASPTPFKRHRVTQGQKPKCITTNITDHFGGGGGGGGGFVGFFCFFSILMNIVFIPKDSSICVLSNDICILLFSPARYPKDISGSLP